MIVFLRDSAEAQNEHRKLLNKFLERSSFYKFFDLEEQWLISLAKSKKNIATVFYLLRKLFTFDIPTMTSKKDKKHVLFLFSEQIDAVMSSLPYECKLYMQMLLNTYDCIEIFCGNEIEYNSLKKELHVNSNDMFFYNTKENFFVDIEKKLQERIVKNESNLENVLSAFDGYGCYLSTTSSWKIPKTIVELTNSISSNISLDEILEWFLKNNSNWKDLKDSDFLSILENKEIAFIRRHHPIELLLLNRQKRQ